LLRNNFVTRKNNYWELIFFYAVRADSYVMRKQKNYREVFSMRSAPRLHKESILRCGVSSARELQLRGTSQRGQKPLNMEAEDATLLEAATKQRSEDRNGAH
jgi:hypothetical protein